MSLFWRLHAELLDRGVADAAALALRHLCASARSSCANRACSGALCAGLLDRGVADAAALALRHTCDALGGRLQPHMDALMALYARVQSCGEASTSFGAAAPPPAPAAPQEKALEESNVLQVPAPHLHKRFP